jgi:hypothetical protein
MAFTQIMLLLFFFAQKELQLCVAHFGPFFIR